MAAIAATLLVDGLVSGAIRLCYKLKLKRAWVPPYRLSWLEISLQAATEKPGRCLAGGTAATVRYSRGGRTRGYGGKAESYPLLLSADTTQHRRVMSLC